jgi:hypothetical protein
MSCRLLLAALALALPPLAADAALGICRQEAARGDGYMQLLCQGEAALEEQQPQAAIKHFSAAAGLERFSASNELAWAGLAAAHCRAGEAQAGREWAQRFDAARRIWIGETPCTLDGGAANPKIPQQVQQQLCKDAFAPDYALLRANPQAAVAQDIRMRLEAVQKGVVAACGAAATAQPVSQAPSQPAPRNARTAKKASGKTASPVPGK